MYIHMARELGVLHPFVLANSVKCTISLASQMNSSVPISKNVDEFRYCLTHWNLTRTHLARGSMHWFSSIETTAAHQWQPEIFQHRTCLCLLALLHLQHLMCNCRNVYCANVSGRQLKDIQHCQKCQCSGLKLVEAYTQIICEGV